HPQRFRSHYTRGGTCWLQRDRGVFPKTPLPDHHCSPPSDRGTRRSNIQAVDAPPWPRCLTRSCLPPPVRLALACSKPPVCGLQSNRQRSTRARSSTRCSKPADLRLNARKRSHAQKRRLFHPVDQKPSSSAPTSCSPPATNG